MTTIDLSTLVAVSGMSPAILAETLWALGEETPPIVPDDVVVITTTKGKEDIPRITKAGPSAIPSIQGQAAIPRRLLTSTCSISPPRFRNCGRS